MRTYFVVFVTSSLQDNSSFCCSCKGITPNAKVCGEYVSVRVSFRQFYRLCVYVCAGSRCLCRLKAFFFWNLTIGAKVCIHLSGDIYEGTNS